MESKEERTRVLRMVQEKKISPEEGLQLLEMLEQQPISAQQQHMEHSHFRSGSGEGKWCRIHVSDMDSGKTKVNIRLPMGLVNAGMKMGSRFSPDMEGVNFSEFIQTAKNGEIGQMIDVYDDEDREHVEIFIE